jgi:uncharacterized membrane protein
MVRNNNTDESDSSLIIKIALGMVIVYILTCIALGVLAYMEILSPWWLAWSFIIFGACVIALSVSYTHVKEEEDKKEKDDEIENMLRQKSI